MKKTLLACMFVVVLGTAATPFYVGAQDKGYVPLAQLPGVESSGDGGVTLEAYLPAVFKLCIGLAFIVAIIMIVLGGVQYMSTDAISGKSAGKERIQSALIGLLLVISAYLILQTISPDLVSFKILDSSDVPAAKSTDSGPATK